MIAREHCLFVGSVMVLLLHRGIGFIAISALLLESGDRLLPQRKNVNDIESEMMGRHGEPKSTKYM